MKRKRQARNERKNGARPIILTHRDIEIFIFIGINRYVSSTQIKQVFFKTQSACNQRLRKLFNNHYLENHSYGSNKPTLHSLTSLAIKAAENEHTGIKERLSAQNCIRLSSIEHHLIIVDTRRYAVRWAEEAGIFLLQWENTGSALSKKTLGLGIYRLDPDAIAAFEQGGQKFFVAVEADTGTEDLPTLTRKCKKYANALRANPNLFAQIWLVYQGENASRQKTLERAILEAGIERKVWLKNYAELCAELAR